MIHKPFIPKKVVKNTIRPINPDSNNINVVKHFHPKDIHCSRRGNVSIKIPEVDCDIDQKHFADIKSKPAPQKLVSTKSLEKLTIIQNIRQARARSLIPLKGRTGSNKYFDSRDSSSSSVETVREKQKTASKCAKSFSDNKNETKVKPKLPVMQNKKTPLSKSDILNVDPKVENLKKEISKNKNVMQLQTKTVFDVIDDNVQKLQEEIFTIRNLNNRNRRTLLTELKTEIAEYKKFDNNYQVYNVVTETSNGVLKTRDDDQNKENDGDFNSVLSSTTTDVGDEKNKDEETSGVFNQEGSTTDERSPRNNDVKKCRHTEFLYTDSDSQEDHIKSKIHEANLLINRVKNALHSIKSITSPSPSPSNGSYPGSPEDRDINKSNSKLRRSQIDYEAIKKYLDRILFEAQYIAYQIQGNQLPAATDVVVKAKKQRVNMESPLSSAGSASSLFAERPKTRRNEDEDIISKEKFKSDPISQRCSEEIKFEEYTSSFEALQAKLQAISEATESDVSVTPESCRKPSLNALINNSEVSGPASNKAMSRLDFPECQSKSHSREEVIDVKLSETQTDSCEVAGAETQTSSKECCLSVVTRPVVCICPAEWKLQPVSQEPVQVGGKKPDHLGIQTMPVISIDPTRLALQNTHHYYISSDGETHNLIRGPPKNVTYLEIDGSISQVNLRVSSKQSVLDNKKKYKLRQMRPTETQCTHSDGEIGNSSKHKIPTSVSMSLLAEKLKGQTSGLPNDKSNIEYGPKRSKHLNQDEMEHREMIYKSYNIRDNPNMHDPDPLGVQSLTKISEIDVQFYETYINPMGLRRGHTAKPKKTPTKTLSESNYKGFISDKEIAIMAAKSATSYKMDSSSVWGLLASKSTQCSASDMKEEKQPERLLSIVERNSITEPDKEYTRGDTESQPAVLLHSEVEKEDENEETGGLEPELMQSSYESIEKISLTLSYSTTESNNSDSASHIPSMTTLHVDRISEEIKETSSIIVPLRRESKIPEEASALSMNDISKLKKIRSKLQSIDPETSVPVLTLMCKTEDDANTTVPLFIKGLVPTVKTFRQTSGGTASDTDTVKPNFSTVLRYEKGNRVPLARAPKQNIEENSSRQTSLVSGQENIPPKKEETLQPQLQSYTEFQRQTLENERKYGKKNPHDELTDEEVARQSVKRMLDNVKKRKSLDYREHKTEKLSMGAEDGDPEKLSSHKKYDYKFESVSNEEMARQTIKDVLAHHKKSVDARARKLTKTDSPPRTTGDKSAAAKDVKDSSSETTNEDDSVDPTKQNNPTVMYAHIEGSRIPDVCGYAHLERASNGRYKDEENLFCQQIYADKKRPLAGKDKPSISELSSKQSTTSDVVTSKTESVSEGEVRLRCKHSVSNGEVHVCKHNRSRHQEMRNKRYKPIQTRKFPKEPFVKVEQRRTYFDNWVTYYVKRSRETFNDSTSSSLK